MPVVTPAEVQTLPSCTNSALASTWISGCRPGQFGAAGPVGGDAFAGDQAELRQGEGAGANRADALRIGAGGGSPLLHRAIGGETADRIVVAADDQ